MPTAIPTAAILADAWPWLALVGALAALLVVDLALVRGRGGEMSLRAAAVASVAWVGIALTFFLVLLVAGDGGDASAFLAGYLVEKSLSLDNVFVFLLVFSAFALPVAERHRLLTYGIVLALVLRALFIVVGAAALGAVGWLSFVFAAFLIWTGWRMFRHRHDHDGEQAMVDRLKRILPMSSAPSDGRLMHRDRSRVVLTTGGAALAGIALVDIVFAVDSVPAILAITSDTFIVFAANAFALLGLRPLFFLVAELVERLYHLKTALAALLVFIGAKMALAEFVGKIGPEISLPIIAAILATGVVASLVRDRRPGGADRPPHYEPRAQKA
ncbi:TerC/Alx family metal homeostasis membrane protein [Capillimicrobium parvum]|uniref:Membrane-bound redox modulator Alx n=1 Tax=Capillimicrobium parvum TaxID=2884022 RepID=A0A9E6XYG1_9ACTN|nr:TerC/Alx family metal homeostasis membrane protein [Capillimicrobium parvum]UGS36550.1 Putative membrane-bound redox modulator Alx [Capillimicrobium parvum]